MTDSPPENETLNQAIRRLCPHCAAGHRPRYRANVREWVHDRVSGLGPKTTGFSTTICGANLVRLHGIGAAR